MHRTVRLRPLALVATLSVFAAGCAITRMSSQANSETVGRTFTRILVSGSFSSLQYRKLAEGKLCEELAKKTTCQCVRATQVFFPGQKYSTDQIARRIKNLHIDAVLSLQPTGSGTSSTYIPPTTYSKNTAYVSRNMASASSTTQTYGGYNIHKPWANYEAVLRSTADGKVAWYATAASGGNAFARWDDLIRSAATKTVNTLVADGVLR